MTKTENKFQSTGAPVYLRDLTHDQLVLMELEIRKSGRKDLIAALDAGEDITIGNYRDLKDMEAD